mgnify:FL=1
MSDLHVVLNEALAGIQPILTASGRAVHLKEVSDTRCVVELTGFCGDCACSDSYKEGIAELIRERSPGVSDVQFIQA